MRSKNSCVRIRWEQRHGSLLGPVSQQEVQFKGYGEGSQLTESERAFPSQFSRAAFPGTAHFLMPHTHYKSKRECVCVYGYIHILYIRPLLFDVVPGETPYQTGIVSETGAGPERTSASDRRKAPPG